jgi:hypothetical protein
MTRAGEIVAVDVETTGLSPQRGLSGTLKSDEVIKGLEIVFSSSFLQAFSRDPVNSTYFGCLRIVERGRPRIKDVRGRRTTSGMGALFRDPK